MPCYDGRDKIDSQSSYHQGRNEGQQESAKTIKDLNDRIKYLNGGLCAILSELEDQYGVSETNEILNMATKNAKFDLIGFWKQHKDEDIARLKKDISKYSDHELDVLEKILNERKRGS